MRCYQERYAVVIPAWAGVDPRWVPVLGGMARDPRVGGGRPASTLAQFNQQK